MGLCDIALYLLAQRPFSERSICLGRLSSFRPVLNHLLCRLRYGSTADPLSVGTIYPVYARQHSDVWDTIVVDTPLAVKQYASSTSITILIDQTMNSTTSNNLSLMRNGLDQ